MRLWYCADTRFSVNAASRFSNRRYLAIMLKSTTFVKFVTCCKIRNQKRKIWHSKDFTSIRHLKMPVCVPIYPSNIRSRKSDLVILGHPTTSCETSVARGFWVWYVHGWSEGWCLEKDPQGKGSCGPWYRTGEACWFDEIHRLPGTDAWIRP